MSESMSGKTLEAGMPKADAYLTCEPEARTPSNRGVGKIIVCPYYSPCKTTIEGAPTS